MEIYKIEDHKKNRKLVYLDEDTPAFCLYSKEIKQFELKEGKEIDSGVYDEIISLLSGRARERCLYLLDDMARTEHQLRLKLKEGFYPEEAIDSAISYCREKHYTDDRDYAERYALAKADTQSRRMTEQKLSLKGISKELIAEVMDNLDINETETVKKILKKKYGDISGYDYEEKQKLIRRLLSKGFSYDAVKTAVSDEL